MMVSYSPVTDNGHSANQPFSTEEIARYSRHFQLTEIGGEGQSKLKRARVLLVGVGGLGSPAALYLAAAGVGTIGVVDPDRVDLTNLQRQVLHGTHDVGRLKVESAVDRIRDVNPHVSVERFDTRLTSANALEVMGGFDIVVDGSDNFPTRYLVNDAAVMLGVPDVYGSVHKFEGQASVFSTPGGPCYRCLFRDPPPIGAIPDCAQAGVLGVMPGLVGMIQATEVLKLILGIGESLAGKLLLIDSLATRFRTIAIVRDLDCPTCGDRRGNTLVDYEQLCMTLSADASSDECVRSITPLGLAERLAAGENIDLVDVREPDEWAIDRIPAARLIPLREVSGSLEGFDPARQTVLYCKTGIRSYQAAEYLVKTGRKNVATLAGGIDRWHADVDPPQIPS